MHFKVGEMISLGGAEEGRTGRNTEGGSHVDLI